MNKKKILFITNGHGEDLVAAQIIDKLNHKKLKIDVMPVVGDGRIFRKLNVKIIGPKNLLPSGGFGLRNYGYLFRDLFSGLIPNTISQIGTLRKNLYEYSLVVGIGDGVPIVYSILTGCNFIIVGVNKSEYYRKLGFNYLWAEKWLLKKYCKLILARDEKTAKALRSFGIKSLYVGNPMMDMGREIRVSRKSRISRGSRGKRTIGFLPGTRKDAYKNIEDFYKIAWNIRKLDKKIRFILSFPETLNRSSLSKIKKPDNIKFIISNDFNKILKRSTIIVGLAGTANEQAAGLGIPVIAFPGRGAQFNSRFAHGQKELLGNSLLLLPRRSQLIAKEAVGLMHNRKKMRRMGKAGIKRMGRPGASKKISNIIMSYLYR
jgi:hypothetical protein